MHLGSTDGPLSLSLSPLEGERVPSGQVSGFTGSKRVRPVRGMLSHALSRFFVAGEGEDRGQCTDAPIAGLIASTTIPNIPQA